MSTYAIGDIQGCLDALQTLLERLRFDPARDRLWLAGDLVNRGPDSLGVLRLVRRLGAAVTTVLGNHDLHLLAVAGGASRGRSDTFDDVLAAPDAADLLDWLSRQPLLHRDTERGWTMIHAGLPPQWDVDQAAALAAEAEAALRSPQRDGFLREMYGDEPAQWSNDLTGTRRLRFIVNCLTRLRYCDAEGRLLLKPKDRPDAQPAGVLPWFAVPGRRSADARIIFGHWSTLGRVHWPEHRVWGLDTGCLWGGQLTALCLETGELTHCECARFRAPG